MNERIKELLNQATTDALYETKDAIDFLDNPVSKQQRELQLEKFAELIVRECARAVDKVYEDAEPDHGCYDWATWAEGADVLKHFGVEE